MKISPTSPHSLTPRTNVTSAIRWRRCSRSSPRRRATTDARPSAATTRGARRRPRVAHGFQPAERIEDAERLRAQVLATDLRPRKPRPIEDEDAEAALGEQDRGGRAGGAGADDDDVEAHALTAMTRPSHG